MKKLTTEEFINRANNIHNDKYQYPQEYCNHRTKLEILCPIHGSFYQNASDHLGGHGCIECAHNRPLNKISFIELARAVHGDKYSYEEFTYINSQTKSNIKCPIHGLFEQKPDYHLKYGCAKCGNDVVSKLKSSNLEEFIIKANEIHNSKYDYLKSNYIDSYTKIEIGCTDHLNIHYFWQKPNCHIQGQGCPKCSGRISKKELVWLDSLGIPDEEHRQVRLSFHNGRRYKVDGFDPLTNTIYEFWGDYYHGNPKTRGRNPKELNKKLKKTYGQLYEETQQKIKDIQDSGFKLVQIWENDWTI